MRNTKDNNKSMNKKYIWYYICKNKDQKRKKIYSIEEQGI